MTDATPNCIRIPDFVITSFLIYLPWREQKRRMYSRQSTSSDIQTTKDQEYTKDWFNPVF